MSRQFLLTKVILLVVAGNDLKLKAYTTEYMPEMDVTMKSTLLEL